MKFLRSFETESNVGVRDRAILETAYATALRRQELASLRITDVDLLQRTIRVVGKGSQERVVPLTKEATTWLRCYLDSSREMLLGKQTTDALWLNRRSRPLASYSLPPFLYNGIDPWRCESLAC